MNLEINKMIMVDKQYSGGCFISIALQGDGLYSVIFFRFASKEDQFIEENYNDEIINNTIYEIVDGTNLLGYASPNGNMILLNNSVDYNKTEGLLSVNQTYLKNFYGINESELKNLVSQRIKEMYTLKK